MTKHMMHRRAPQEFHPSAAWQNLTVSAAILRLLEERGPTVKPNTAKSWRSVARTMRRLIKGPIASLTAEAMLSYQRDRVKNGTKPSTARTEACIAFIAIRRSGRKDMKLKLIDSQAPRPGIALAPADKERIIQASKTHPDLHLAVLLGLLGLRYHECLHLERRDYNTEKQTLDVRASKTKAGIRRIPVTKLAHEKLVDRLNQIGLQPNHPIFPGRNDRMKYRTEIDHAWTAMRKKIGLTHVRFHDLRHTAITDLCEAGIPEAVIRSYVGHVDEEMLKLYSHPRQEAMQRAARALDPSTALDDQIPNEIAEALAAEIKGNRANEPNQLPPEKSADSVPQGQKKEENHD